MTKPSFFLIFSLFACGALAGCHGKFDPDAGAAPPAKVTEVGNAAIVNVANPQQYPTVAAERVDEPDELNVTGAVFPDISREVPVISLANGRVVDIKVRLDDNVKKGQFLFSVQSPDITNAFDAYLKAVNDEQMNNKAYLRAQDLYNHGAISQAMLEQAEDTERDCQSRPDRCRRTVEDATAWIKTTRTRCGRRATRPYPASSSARTSPMPRPPASLCPARPRRSPSPTSPASGSSATSTRTICRASISASRRASSSMPIPTARSPASSATSARSSIPISAPPRSASRSAIPASCVWACSSPQPSSAAIPSSVAVIPASAILHLHDRDWVFVPAGDSQFKRLEVHAGDMLPGNRQEILSGIDPGQQVVRDVVALEATAEAQ